jgi:hypothetical protein
MITHGSKEADAIAELLGTETLITLRLALRQAAHHDKIGNRHSFAVLYHQLGGEADLTLEAA